MSSNKVIMEKKNNTYREGILYVRGIPIELMNSFNNYCSQRGHKKTWVVKRLLEKLVSEKFSLELH